MWKWLKRLLFVAMFFAFAGIAAIAGMYYYVKPDLPDVKSIKTVQLQTPMKVFSSDGELISQFGEKRRIPLEIQDIPAQMIDAFLATEDSRYYQHPGIDPIGIVRAAIVYLSSGQAKQGASTITQQVARNFFLTREKTLIRKIKEVFIAIHIEQLLTKDEILALYLNKIPLGYRSYGVGAAAQVYYGKDVSELTLAQTAVIAGLPKAPSKLNPIYSPENAKARRSIVLQRMLEEGHISKAEFEQANNAPITAKYHGAEIALSAPFVAEMARQQLIEMYGEEAAYNQGLNVYTTVNFKDQQATQQALMDNLQAYDRRHGYRGPIEQLWQKDEAAWAMQKIYDHLDSQPYYGPLRPAVVTKIDKKEVEVLVQGGKAGIIAWEDMQWARRFVNDKRQGPAPKKAASIFNLGDMVWVRIEDEKIILAQLPDAAGALVAINPLDGAIQGLSGGFDFKQSKFNRATMAKRQVGSNIKPFVYSAALENGFTLGTLVNDSPINHWDTGQGIAWRPKNSPAVYDGPIRVRVALAKSKNVVSVRLLRSIGIQPLIDHLAKFGFSKKDLPENESIALGTPSLTPLEVATAYAVLANGGYKVSPYIIAKIEDAYGNLVYQAAPDLACINCPDNLVQSDENSELDVIETAVLDVSEQPKSVPDASTYVPEKSKTAPQVISSANAFLMREALNSGVWGGSSHGKHWNGTGWRAASALKRHDIGGKTGTTNDSKDAWFSGISPYSVATAWVGFDNHARTLGYASRNANLGNKQRSGGEFGGSTALPAWIAFMKVYLADKEEQDKQIPRTITKVAIDKETGLLSNGSGNSRTEYYEKGTEPTSYQSELETNFFESGGGDDELF
ncbi:penicillin-binding protein 1A [Motilimonas pumila]|uniref:Penicillin-binding protein 1A n=1 Tax=Motilimonas pumila TaxID=2303987 RepID=A0A418YCX2_9GAMM|nr:PBP1A family penicillin-binding protein [Motilimonas pumila]RJG42379.1 PBP1A family penicillin-binding protein [Motilimonas pumila]